MTGIDLVQAQFLIASGSSLEDLGIRQESITVTGAALQCRITTEDPMNEFRPDSGRITGYRSAGGAGIRLDGGTVATGAEVLPYFDSLLVKVTARGRTWEEAVARSRRAITEFRIRGVATNITFLQAVLSDPDFTEGRVTTALLEEKPYLLEARSSTDRGSRPFDLPRRGDGQPTARPSPTACGPALQAARDRPLAAPPRRAVASDSSSSDRLGSRSGSGTRRCSQ